MKKGFSLILALVMLLSLLPTAAFALEAADEAPAEEAAVQQEQQEREIRPEIRPEPLRGEPLTEPQLLSSGTATVKGTVSLPAGCKALADSYLYVSLYTPPVLDESGQVLTPATSVRSTPVKFAQGASSASYSISSVEAGSYILRIYSYVSHTGALSGESFYSGDGTLAANVYAASPMTLSAGGTRNVNLTLPAAPRSISGTLTFDTAAAEDTEIWIFTSNHRRENNVHYGCEVILKQGSTSVDFAVGVTPDIYSIEFENELTGTYGYCGLDGTLTTEWQERMLFDTRDASVSGLEEDGSVLLDGNAEDLLMVTVHLPAALTEGRQYGVWLMDEEGYERSNYSTYVEAGQSSFTLPMPTYFSDGERFYLGYNDVTDASDWWADAPDMRYAAEDGITTILSQAKAFVAGQDTEVVLTEPACYTVTGMLERTANTSSSTAAYAIAEFADGECYATRVVFAPGVESAPYTIYVPKSQAGNHFDVSAGPAQGILGMRVDEELLTEGAGGTLSGSMAMGTITLASRASTIRGTLSLPDGFAALEGGMEVTFSVVEDYNETPCATYYLPEGESSFSYELCAPVSGDSVQICAELDGRHDGLYFRTLKTFSSGDLDAADLTILESVSISGTVSVPESCREGIAVVEISAADEEYFYNNYFYALIPAGEVSASYSFTMPKDVPIARICARVQGDTQGVLSTSSLYLQEDGSFSSNYPALSLMPDNGLTVNFSMPRAAYLSGTISLASGMAEGYYEGSIRVENLETGRVLGDDFAFYGTSTDYRIPLPSETASYRISIYVHEGSGTILSKYYYYSESGMTPERDAAAPVSADSEGASLDLTIPRAKLISGRFTAADGGDVTWNSEGNQYFYLISKEDSSQIYCPTAVDAQGNWTIALDPSITGEYYLRTYVDTDSQSNIIDKSYFYSGGSTVATSQDSAGTITIGAEDISGLKLYVDTGWILSGSVRYADGGYLTAKDYSSLSLSLSASCSENSIYRSGSCKLTASGGTYSIVVPKTVGVYTIETGSTYITSGTLTNLYFPDQTLESVSVTGDTAGLDFIIPVTDTVITGTIFRPAGVSNQYLNIHVGLVTSNYGFYQAEGSMARNANSSTFCIPIDPDDTSETYQLRYILQTSVDGLINGYDRNIYLCEDSTLTTDGTLAGNFSLADNRSVSFTLLTAEPFARGRIYCPEGLTEDIRVWVSYETVNQVSIADRDTNGTNVWVGPGFGQLDAEGRRYSTYSLSSTDMSAGDTYLLYYVVDDSEAQELMDTEFHYLDSSGAFSTGTVFTVPSSGSNNVDFTLYLWEDGVEDFLFQSGHGIDSTAGTLTYTYTYPGEAESLTVTFSTRTDVALTINGKNYPAYQLLKDPEVIVDGNTLEITLTVPDSDQKYFGFAVEDITASNASVTSPGVAAVYTVSGSAGSDILSDLKEGQPVRLTLVDADPSETTEEAATVAGVLYDADGRMVDFVQVPVELADGGTATAALYFEEYGQAVTLEILLLSDSWSPLMREITLTAQ